MNLAALPRISARGFHALFDGEPLVAVELHVVDDDALQAALPEARALIVAEAGTDKGRSAAFVITDPPPLPKGADPAALTVALTFVKD